jgi:hypothetical protein
VYFFASQSINWLLDRFYTNYYYDYRGYISSHLWFIVINYYNVKLHFTSLAFTHKDVGGYAGLVDKYATTTIRACTMPYGNELCEEVPGDAMHLLRCNASYLIGLPHFRQV